jgi:hypothetical protein
LKPRRRDALISSFFQNDILELSVNDVYVDP